MGQARRRLDSLHPVGFSTLALAQPLYGLIADNPQFLAAHAAGRRDLALLALALSVLLPLGFMLPELLAAPLGDRARTGVRTVVIGLLVTLLASQVAARLLPTGGVVVLAASAAAGVSFAVAYHRWPALRSFSSLLALAAVIAPLVFLFDPRVREFWRAPRASPNFAVEFGNPVPVVTMILDELPLVALLDERADVDARLFPSFARLAAQSHWFRNATTPGNYTDLAVPAIHTGRYPSEERLLPATLETHPGNLFTLLGGSYRIHSIETTTNLRPRSIDASATENRRGSRRRLLLDVGAVALHVVTPPPWNDRLPPLHVGWADFWGHRGRAAGGAAPGDRLAEARSFVEQLEADRQPAFVYLHLLLPHIPWEYLPSGRTYYEPHFVAGLIEGELWTNDATAVELGYQRLLLQLRAVDTVLGALLDRLEELDWLDRGIVVLTADHGAAFTPGRPRRNLLAEHEDTVLAEIMPVPLFVKLPGQREGVVHDDSVELIDVLPTLAEILEVEVPWSVDGSSMLHPADAPRASRSIQLREPYVRLRFDRSRAAPLASMARERSAWFGRAADGGRDLFRAGPHPDLIGRPAIASATSELDLRAILHDEQLWQDVDTGDARVPGLVRGEIRSEGGTSIVPGAHAIAVAVNGVVRATTRTYADPKGAAAFAAMVPEDAFASGGNDLEIFVVDAERRPGASRDCRPAVDPAATLRRVEPRTAARRRALGVERLPRIARHPGAARRRRQPGGRDARRCAPARDSVVRRRWRRRLRRGDRDRVTRRAEAAAAVRHARRAELHAAPLPAEPRPRRTQHHLLRDPRARARRTAERRLRPRTHTGGRALVRGARPRLNRGSCSYLHSSLGRPYHSGMDRRFRSRLGRVALLATLALLGFPLSAHAYLDPASGSMLLQLLLGGLAGAAVALKLLWRRIAGPFQRRKSDEPRA